MSARILVLEDDELLQEVLIDTLEEADYSVVGVSNSLEALRLVEQQRYQLILADIRMKGMDGLDCLAELRKARPEIRSIVITGYASEDAPKRAVKVEAEDYLYKPLDLEELLLSVQRVLGSDAERKQLSDLLSPLRRWVTAAGEAMARAGLGSIEAGRQRAFRSFYVAVRSRSLELNGAHAVWIQLHRLELLRQQEPDRQTRQALAEGYEAVVTWLTAMSKSGLAALAPNDDLVSRGQFTALYRNLGAGRLSVEELKMAPLLHSLADKMGASPPVQELYHQLWSAPS